MDNQSNLYKLSDKVSSLLAQFHSLKAENEMLRNEVSSLKQDKLNKDEEIQKLIEENTKKDMEIEEIANNIENILG